MYFKKRPVILIFPDMQQQHTKTNVIILAFEVFLSYTIFCCKHAQNKHKEFFFKGISDHLILYKTSHF